ncbi:hypothetical protein LEP1GSC050_1635 [Leptospira broomii serovar Hurstbridge str. 5399]|uniref:Uncharacterized protein n=1 Tax=Leptospira broomii serovar Hurstbridge str. 5399 TaxID=1049789 RepID=T0EXY6_9LEPT|nr:hypothetical protein LEP1GSC050_1635 [Leptospira broomii serovar Hurstbridge str. 5399]
MEVAVIMETGSFFPHADNVRKNETIMKSFERIFGILQAE